MLFAKHLIKRPTILNVATL